uniref:Uncharacterized protein n=1 Tax=Nicotiana tabacum TaxID=4097 RepID=A0A1S4B6R9_TOBAC|nr:PREDICTED: uncharacterized protein LOC107805097 [Nicotiana tabacum]
MQIWIEEGSTLTVRDTPFAMAFQKGSDELERYRDQTLTRDIPSNLRDFQYRGEFLHYELAKSMGVSLSRYFPLFFERRPVALFELLTTSRDSLFPINEFMEIKEELQKIGLETLFSMGFDFAAQVQMQVSAQENEQALVTAPVPLLTSKGNQQNFVSGQENEQALIAAPSPLLTSKGNQQNFVSGQENEQALIAAPSPLLTSKGNQQNLIPSQGNEQALFVAPSPLLASKGNQQNLIFGPLLTSKGKE